MTEQTKKKLYPDLSLEDISRLVPKYHSLPQQPTEASSRPSKDGPSFPQTGPPSLPHNLQPPSPSLDKGPLQKHYMSFLQDYVEKIDEILEKFEEIKKRPADYHYKSNCAKVSGTVVSSTGVALVISSLWWAPVTAGSSLILGAGGAVMSVTGSLTNALTDYIDYKTTATIMKDIKLLLREKEMFDMWMRKSITHFNECITQLMAEGLTREVAISTIIEGVAKGAINIMEKPNNQVLSSLSTAVKMHRIQHLQKPCQLLEKRFT
uniref:DUF4781 domain-containing protein n=1 Tax=Dendroctonus ponderosae TaxID=77166 RepID=A0AAR5P9R4_DENPD